MKVSEIIIGHSYGYLECPGVVWGQVFEVDHKLVYHSKPKSRESPRNRVFSNLMGLPEDESVSKNCWTLLWIFRVAWNLLGPSVGGRSQVGLPV
jgi:hypothetical protein